MISIIKIEFSQGVCPGMKSVSAICKKLSAKYLRSLILAYLKPLDPELWDDCAVSNTMPFQCGQLYVEKPALITEGLQDLSLADHKFHRIMKYLKLSDLRSFFDGSYDFARNAKTSFGHYQKTAENEYFIFSEGSGLYFCLKSPRSLSPKDRNALCQRLEHEIARIFFVDAVAVSIAEGYQEYFLHEEDRPVLSLTDLDTRSLSVQHLEQILEGASFQAAYASDGFGVIILAGAWFPHALLLPNEIVCIDIK